MFFMIPVVDTLSQVVDQRVRVTSVSAESTLTRDTVPVNVDAITLSAQTALSDARSNEVQALHDYNVAIATLERVTGMTVRAAN